jgi:rubrerythrin
MKRPFSNQAVMSLARGRHNDAEDQQPWRCKTCGEAVSHINPRDCACIRALRAKAATEPAP